MGIFHSLIHGGFQSFLNETAAVGKIKQCHTKLKGASHDLARRKLPAFPHKELSQQAEKGTFLEGASKGFGSPGKLTHV